MKCSPKIWNKFSAEEKKLWTKFNKAFQVPKNLPTKLEEFVSDEERQIIAHNLAVQAVYALRGVDLVGYDAKAA